MMPVLTTNTAWYSITPVLMTNTAHHRALPVLTPNTAAIEFVQFMIGLAGVNFQHGLDYVLNLL